jgi:hypothetical protein
MAKVSIDVLAFNEMKKARHLLYSPALAHLDFFRWGEKRSDGISCREFIRASGPYSGHFEAIPREIFVRVFLEWMKRSQRGIDSSGEYVG